MKGCEITRFSTWKVVCILTLIVTGMASAALAVPYVFSPGTTISSSEVNSNFAGLANALPGINVNATGMTAVTLSSTVSTVISLELIAPADGYVLVHYTGLANIVHTTGTRDLMRIEIRDDDFTSISNTYSFISYQVPSEMPTTSALYGFYTPVSTQRVFPVTGGQAYTFYVRGDAFGAGGSLLYNQVTGLFVPRLIGTPTGY